MKNGGDSSFPRGHKVKGANTALGSASQLCFVFILSLTLILLHCYITETSCDAYFRFPMILSLVWNRKASFIQLPHQTLAKIFPWNHLSEEDETLLFSEHMHFICNPSGLLAVALVCIGARKLAEKQPCHKATGTLISPLTGTTFFLTCYVIKIY